MAKFGKWLGSGLGWAMGGPIGAIIGFAIGSMVDNATVAVTRFDPSMPPPRTREGDFSVSLLILSAAVMKSDGRILKAELEYVKHFFVKQFGVAHTKEQMLLFREIIKQDIPVHDVCSQIRHYMDHPSRLQLIHYLFGISLADRQIHSKEVETITMIANYLGISINDFNSIKAMFYSDADTDYKILEIPSTATDEEVRKAYRRMAVKFHPDKVAHIGEDVQHAAKEKFQKVQQSYENIKKHRNLV